MFITSMLYASAFSMHQVSAFSIRFAPSVSKTFRAIISAPGATPEKSSSEEATIPAT